MGVDPPRLLFISNGFGEDRIAVAIARRCLTKALSAMPLVGQGDAYRSAGIPVVGPTADLPSGGFVLHDGGALARDLAHGLLTLTGRQIRAAWRLRGSADLVVAVGDLVPLALAWLIGAPYVLVGCAKSDHYTHGRFSDYFAHERWFLAQRRCQAVYCRDGVTARNLEARGYRAFDLGNPMMDDLDPEPEAGAVVEARGAGEAPLAIGLLPGSRQEAYANMPSLLACCREIAARSMGVPVVFRTALAGQIEMGRIVAGALSLGWTAVDPRDLGQVVRLEGPRGERLILEQGRFAQWCQSVRIVIGLAGTANEQCAGLGLPLVTFPGTGPQFNARFARRQVRLLGESVTLVEPRPEAVAAAVWEILGDPYRCQRIALNGRERMGPPGAARRIADHLAGLSAIPSGRASF